MKLCLCLCHQEEAPSPLPVEAVCSQTRMLAQPTALSRQGSPPALAQLWRNPLLGVSARPGSRVFRYSHVTIVMYRRSELRPRLLVLSWLGRSTHILLRALQRPG